MKMKLQKDKLYGQKKVYLVLIIVLLVGMFLGFMLPFILSSDNVELLKISVTNFFNNVMNDALNYKIGIKNSLVSNITFVFGVWLLGISIIGFPFVMFLMLYKGFIFGFSFCSIIYIYGLKGIPVALFYVFPGNVLALVGSVLLCFYSVSFSIKLFRYLFLKENLNFKAIMNRYFKILGICLGIFVIVSLLDVYLSPILMNFFTFLLK